MTATKLGGDPHGPGAHGTGGAPPAADGGSPASFPLSSFRRLRGLVP